VSVQDAAALALEIDGAALPGLQVRRAAFRASPGEHAPFNSGEGWIERRPDGMRSARLEAEGLLTGADAETALRDSFLGQTSRPWRVRLPGSGRLDGPFLVENIEYSGADPGQARYAFALVSAGALTFTPDP
jgi:predicted secreted protein